VDTLRASRVESGDQLHFRGNPRQMVQQQRNRRLAAVAMRADGRRVPVQLPVAEVSILARLERVALELLGILTGSRRETGGKRG
jgi:hypothetical protein